MNERTNIHWIYRYTSQVQWDSNPRSPQLIEEWPHAYRRRTTSQVVPSQTFQKSLFCRILRTRLRCLHQRQKEGDPTWQHQQPTPRPHLFARSAYWDVLPVQCCGR